MISKYLIHLTVICLVFNFVKFGQTLESDEVKLRNERSLALFLAPNRTQNLKGALENQVLTTAIKGHIYINIALLAFEVIGYTFAGTIYTFLNTNFGVQNNFLDSNLGPMGSLLITFRWIKVMSLAILFFVLFWAFASPQETFKILSKIGFNQFVEFNVNQNLPMFIIREFITDFTFGVAGWTIFWMIARRMDNVSANPAILFLRVLGLQDPNRNSRSLMDSEESISKGFHDMLKTIPDSNSQYA